MYMQWEVCKYEHLHVYVHLAYTEVSTVYIGQAPVHLHVYVHVVYTEGCTCTV